MSARLFTWCFISAALFLLLSFSFPGKEEVISPRLDKYVVTHISDVLSLLDSLGNDFSEPVISPEKCRRHYEAARSSYKAIEFYTEYHFPFQSKYFINGPFVSKAEAEYSYKTFLPHGFQVLESVIYGAPDSTIHIQYELELLKKTFQYVREQSGNKQFKNTTVVDMMRFGIIRIMSLYMNGYDCTFNKQSIPETGHILEGFSFTIGLMPGNASQKARCSSIISGAQLFLSKNNGYDSFPRLPFIMHYLKPLYESLYGLYDDESRRESTNYAVQIRQEKFYGESWFNRSYFSVVLKDSAFVRQQAALGELLFFDPILSGNNKRACASCHDPGHGFGGSSDFNLSYNAGHKLKRNTPSLINVLFQKSFFDDGRSLQLEDQVSDVLNNPEEMGADAESIVKKLRQSREYKKLFRNAFANTEDTALTYYAVLKALSEYERSLVALGSRFDRYLRGDEKQLTNEEIDGYSVFAGKALCGSCHFFPLFNGVTPPFYSDNEYEVIGVPKDKLGKEADPDSGRFAVSKNKIHLGAFKISSIRNIDRTAPYMHNSAYSSIDEIIDFYRKGGGAGLGLAIPNQTLPFDSLRLSTSEAEHLKKFLLSLSDNNFHPPLPEKLPPVEIKGLEKRVVGGSY